MGRPKQLLPVAGKPVLQHVVDTAAAAAPDEILVVLGHEADEIEGVLRLPETARIVLNPNYAEGQSTSLRAGLEAADPSAAAAVILLGDQPYLRSDTIRLAFEHFCESPSLIVQATYGGRPGHPVVFDRAVWSELLSIEGDTGARDLLRGNPERVTRVEVGGEPPRDLDTWEDYQLLTSSGN